MNTDIVNRFKELFSYDENSGRLTRIKVISTKSKVGDIIGTVNNKGYLQTMVDGKMYCVHKIAYSFIHGYYPEHIVDHKDRDTQNNSAENLRKADASTNSFNRKVRSDSSSGIRNVKKGDKFYSVKVQSGTNKIYIGKIKSVEDAIFIASELRKDLHGDFFMEF